MDVGQDTHVVGLKIKSAGCLAENIKKIWFKLTLLND